MAQVRIPGGLTPSMDFDSMAGAVDPTADLGPGGMVESPLKRAKSVEDDPASQNGALADAPGPFPAPEEDDYEHYVPRRATLPPPTLKPGETPGAGMPGMPAGPGGFGVPDDDILSSIMAGVTKPIGGI
jgi:hypothetical protein